MTPRSRRGAVLVLGGAVVLLAVELLDVDFSWLPLLVGLTYLVAAAVAGRREPLWAPGLLTTGFGVAAALAYSGPFAPGDLLQLTLVALGLAAAVASLLTARAGFAVGLPSVAMTLLVLGVFVVLTTRVGGVFDEAWAYAVLLAGWGAWELRPAGTVRRLDTSDRP